MPSSNADWWRLHSLANGTRGTSLINDWPWDCTPRWEATWQAGSSVVWLVVSAVSVCGWKKRPFSSWRGTCLCFRQRDWAEKLAKKKKQGEQKWRSECSSTELPYKIPQIPKSKWLPPIQPCVNAHAFAMFMTTSNWDWLYWRGLAMKHWWLSSYGLCMASPGRIHVSVDADGLMMGDWGGVDIVIDLNGASPLFMRQYAVVS